MMCSRDQITTCTHRRKCSGEAKCPRDMWQQHVSPCVVILLVAVTRGDMLQGHVVGTKTQLVVELCSICLKTKLLQSGIFNLSNLIIHSLISLCNEEDITLSQEEPKESYGGPSTPWQCYIY